jgi:Rrf2 family iron-sulfur cluster assembly transcriptional regulator
MMISTRGRYALRVMIDLAEHSQGSFIPLKDIAERQDISQKYLESIMTILSKKNLVQGVHGKGGGYSLIRDPKDYKIGEILHSTEGSLAPVACLECGVSTCDRAADCKTLPMWGKLNNIINQYLDHITLDDLIHNTIEERLKNKDWLK